MRNTPEQVQAVKNAKPGDAVAVNDPTILNFHVGRPTPQMVLAEPAGPRLDAWVAEYVMGYAKTNDDRVWSVGGGSVPAVTHLTWTPRCPHFRFLPSSDWGCAGQVVEKMAAKSSCHPFIRKTSYQDKKTCLTMYDWTCGIEFFEGDGSRFHEARADTFPLAACRAALLAMIGGG